MVTDKRFFVKRNELMHASRFILSHIFYIEKVVKTKKYTVEMLRRREVAAIPGYFS
jgi:hypothetical protein